MLGNFPCTCNNCGQRLISVEYDDTHSPTLDNRIAHFLLQVPETSEEKIVAACPQCGAELDGRSTTLIQEYHARQ